MSMTIKKLIKELQECAEYHNPFLEVEVYTLNSREEIDRLRVVSGKVIIFTKESKYGR